LEQSSKVFALSAARSGSWSLNASGSTFPSAIGLKSLFITPFLKVFEESKETFFKKFPWWSLRQSLKVLKSLKVLNLHSIKKEDK